jgi:type VI secretion system protein ImpI
MDMLFEIVSRQKYSASFPAAHVFDEAGGYIGRSEECEWTLPDNARQISRKHALISFEDGEFFIEDVSANGIFRSLGNEPLGKGKRCKIAHGEGFVIGAYTIAARLLHNPSAYAEPTDLERGDIRAFAAPLSLNPLTAMDQEEEMLTRQRLGEYDDILGPQPARSAFQSDQSDPRAAVLPPIVAVPEQDLIPEDWDAPPDEEAWPAPTPPAAAPPRANFAAPADVAAFPEAAPPSPATQRQAPPPRQAAPSHQNAQRQAPSPEPARGGPPLSESEIFFKALGFAEAPPSPEERARVLEIAAHLLVASVRGMTGALQHRNACKNELRLSITTSGLNISNNPLKFSPTPEAALATLLGQAQKGVLPPVESMREGFENLHSHHMGLMAGARAAVRACLDRLAPSAVEARLDSEGPTRFNRPRRLWHAFVRMHQSLRDNHDGFAAFFLQDFARAYELQGRTLKPPVSSKGEQQ